MALDFTITSPTTGLGAGTPSRAMSLTLTGSGTLGSAGSFALSDGSAGGTFYPASPVTIASGSGAGTVKQFVYTPAIAATGTITLTATATGGLAATHSLSLQITTNATVFARDTFAGTVGVDIGSRTPDTGGAYTRQYTTTSIQLLGSSSAGGAAGSHEGYYIPAANSGEYDVSFDLKWFDDVGQMILAAQCSGALPPTLEGYLLNLVSGTWTLTGYLASNPTAVFTNLAAGTITSGATYAVRLAFRMIGGLQYIWFFLNNVAASGSPFQDGLHTTGYPGLWNNGQATLTTGQPIKNFQAVKPDWVGSGLALTGPTSGTTGAASTNFTITATTLSGPDTVTLHATGGGSFSPAGPLSFASGSSSQTFTFTPSADGGHAISITDSLGAVISGSPITYTSSPAVVSSLALSGPTAGITGAASTPFSVTATTLSGSDTVMVHGTGGGTFAPSGTLSFTAGSGVQTFAYTPTTDGAHAISITDTLPATISGSPITYTSIPAAAVITFPNANVFLSPGVFKVAGGSATMTGTYGYLKGIVTGTTTFGMDVDTSINSGQAAYDMPTLVLTLNHGPPAYVRLGVGATSVTLATGLTAGTSYTYKVECLHGNQGVGNSWTGATSAVKLVALRFDGGATLSASPLRSRRAVVLGASGEQPYNGSTILAGAPYTDYVDARKGWWVGVMQGYDAEFGVHGAGGCSFLNPGQGGYPVFGSWWDHLDSATPRTWGTVDALIAHVGENDQNTGHTSGETQTACTTWLTAARAALPTSWIFLHLPWQATTTARTGILAAVAAFNDPKVKTLDPGLEFIAGFTGAAGEFTADGLHGNDRGYGILDGIMARQLQAAIGGAATFSPLGSAIIRGI